MEIFSMLLANCAGNSPVTGEFPVQRPVTQYFDVFCDLRLSKRLSKQSGGSYLRCNRAHYAVTVMLQHGQAQHYVIAKQNKIVRCAYSLGLIVLA